MTPPEAIDLAALRMLAEKATPGPWTIDLDDAPMEIASVRGADGEYTGIAVDLAGRQQADIDLAAYVVEFNPRTVLALLDRLALAEAVVEAVKQPTTATAWYRTLAERVAAYDRAIAGQQQGQEGT